MTTAGSGGGQVSGRSARYAAALSQAKQLRDDRRWREAEAAVDAALDVWPDDESFLFVRAALSQAQQQWAESAKRYAALRTHHPTNFFGWSRGAESLRWLKRLSEADELLSLAVERFPTNDEVLAQRVLIACDRGHWEEAQARAETLLARLPDNAASYRFASEVDARQGRIIDAELMVAEGLQLFGFQPTLSLRFAELASLRKDWSAAARRWATVVRQMPESEAAHRGLAAVLRHLGRTDELAKVVSTACQSFPQSIELAIENAWLAAARDDWAAAMTQWQALMDRAPGHPGVRRGFETAASHIAAGPVQAGSLQAQVPAIAATVSAQRVTGAATRAAVTRIAVAGDVASVISDPARLMLCFESIGAGCEFGVVQRRAGIEPLGLLRFTGTKFDHLIAALDSDFAGVGEPPFTRVHLRDGVEYMISDTRYWRNMHSFTGPGQVSPEQFTSSTMRHLQFLARKLREDLGEAAKILVRTDEDGAQPSQRVLELHRSLCRYSPHNTLLFVEKSADASRIGGVEWSAPGVMIGAISHYDVANPDNEQWLSICRNAYRLWSAEPSRRGFAAPR